MQLAYLIQAAWAMHLWALDMTTCVCFTLSQCTNGAQSMTKGAFQHVAESLFLPVQWNIRSQHDVFEDLLKHTAQASILLAAGPDLQAS